MFVFPGETVPQDFLPSATEPKQSRCKLGQGILPLNNSVVTVRAGTLRLSKSSVSLQSSSKLVSLIKLIIIVYPYDR